MHIHYDITLAPTSYTRDPVPGSASWRIAQWWSLPATQRRTSQRRCTSSTATRSADGCLGACNAGEFWVEIYLDLDPPFVEISGCLTPLMVVLLAFFGGV